MRKIFFSILFLITAIFASQIIIANDNLLIVNSNQSSKEIELEVFELKNGSLKQEVNDRLGNRDINGITKLTITSGLINNNDFKFISDEIKNLKVLDLANTLFNEKELLVTFNEKNKLEEIYFPASAAGYKLSDKILKDSKNLNKVELNGVKSLGKFVFENTTSLNNIDLTSVDDLGEGAFLKSAIETITFKDSYDLPEAFFKETKSLTNIDISGAKTIGKAVFSGSNVEYIKMPQSYALEGYTFAKTKNLIRIDLSGATRLGEADFLESNIEEVILPSKYNLPDLYFSKTLNLKSADISNASDIGFGVFSFSNIEKITFPKNFTLSEGLLQYTEKLKTIDVSGATDIEEAVFAGSSLNRIILPEKFEVTNAMFGFMENLNSIDLSGAEFLDSNIFVKKGNNYDYYRKFFDGSDLVSSINDGVQSIILGKVVPSVAVDSFANLNDNPPIILLPKAKEWDGLSNNLMSKNNEIETLLRYDSFTYRDLMISKNTLIQIGFSNPVIQTKEEKEIDVKYQWYFNDNEIVNGNQSTFTVDNFTINDEGSYRLEVLADGITHKLFDIELEANELAIDSDTLYKGYFLNEVIDESLVSVLYVKDDIRQQVSMDDLNYEYDFSEVGNTSINITYTKDDLLVVADYPVKVANTLPSKIKLKTKKTYNYDPMMDGFEFILTSNQKEFFEIEEVAESNELIIKANEKYSGQLDYKFNGRVGQVEIEIVNNFLWLWISLGVITIVAFGSIIYLRETKGMFKIKKQKNINEDNI